MSNVFISYKRENLAAVTRLVEALRGEGIGVWWDQDIPPNAAWEATIERALADARLVVVAWSPASVASENVKAEARWARGQGRLLQVFVEACEPPLFFGERQGMDLKGWSGAASEPAFRAVLEAIQVGLHGSLAPTEQTGGPKDAPLALPAKPSIAVLPFTDMTGGRDQDYFADGMVEEIVTALSRFPTLFVIAAGSSLSYRDTTRTLPQIGQELGVRYLLEGSVRKAGERVRITVKLTDALAATPLWTERFDGTLVDVFELQDTVANAVVAQVIPTMEAAELRRADTRPTTDLSAYDLFLRARHLFQMWDKESLEAATALLDQAVTRDPGFAPAYALAGYVHTLLGLNELSDDPALSLRMGLDLSRRALAAGDGDAEVLAWVAAARMQAAEDITGVDSLMARSLALNPGLAIARWGTGWCKLYLGQTDLAQEHLVDALRMDPRSGMRPITVAGLGYCSLFAHRYEEAARLLIDAAESRPSIQRWTLTAAAAAYAHLGEPARARQLLARMPSPIPASYNRSIMGLFRRPEDRELIRSGLVLAGADV